MTGFPGGSLSIYGHKKKISTSLCFYIGTSCLITMKKRQPRRNYSLGLVKASSAFLETQLGRHTLLYKLTRKVTICLLGSTNSKLISSCACFTCRVRILIKHNEPSLQEISTNINYWNQQAGCNNSPLSSSPLWPSAGNLTKAPWIWNYELPLKHMKHRETFVIYEQLWILKCVAA